MNELGKNTNKNCMKNKRIRNEYVSVKHSTKLVFLTQSKQCVPFNTCLYYVPITFNNVKWRIYTEPAF